MKKVRDLFAAAFVLFVLAVAGLEQMQGQLPNPLGDCGFGAHLVCGQICADGGCQVQWETDGNIVTPPLPRPLPPPTPPKCKGNDGPEKGCDE